MHIASTQKQSSHHQPKKSTQYQPNNSAHSIRLPFGWFPWSENFDSSQHPTPLCHSARSRRRSRRIHHPKNNPRPLREGDVADDGRGSGESTFPHPSSAYVHLLPREKVIFKHPCQTNSRRGETEQGMIAGLSKISVTVHSFLPAMVMNLY